MGKAEIISEIGAGQYNIVLRYERSHYEKTIAALEAKIIEYNNTLSDYIVAHPNPTDAEQEDIDRYNLYITAFEKRLEQLQEKGTADKEMAAWCADLTLGLSPGLEIGTMETPDEGSTSVIIRPGYDGLHLYDADRDGQLQPALNGLPYNTAFNWMLLPAYQKWRPYHRTGIITAIDYTGDTCDIDLDAAESIAQGLDVNQVASLSDVPIDYMQCNSGAFEVGDSVVVEFQDFDIDNPKVLGFKENPQSCGEYLVFVVWDGGPDVFAGGLDPAVRCFVWDIENDEMATIDGVTFPCSYYDANLQAWLANKDDITGDLFIANEFGVFPWDVRDQQTVYPERFIDSKDCISYSFDKADLFAMDLAGEFYFPVANEYTLLHPWNFYSSGGTAYRQYDFPPRSYSLSSLNGFGTDPCVISDFTLTTGANYTEKSTTITPLDTMPEIIRYEPGTSIGKKGIKTDDKSCGFRLGGVYSSNAIMQFYFAQWVITDNIVSLLLDQPTDERSPRQTEIHASCDWIPDEAVGFDWSSLSRNTDIETAISDLLDDVYTYTERYVNSDLAQNILFTIAFYKILLAGGGAPLTPENVALWTEQLEYWEAQLANLETELGVPNDEVLEFLTGTVFIAK